MAAKAKNALYAVLLLAAFGVWSSVFWGVDYVKLAEAAWCQALVDCTGSGNKVSGSDWNAARTIGMHEEKCATIETPTDADTFMVWRTDLAVTVTDVDCIVEDATSAVITLQECDTAGDNCTAIESAITCDVVGASDDGTIDNGGLDAGDIIRVDVGTITGTPGHVNVCWVIARDQ